MIDPVQSILCENIKVDIYRAALICMRKDRDVISSLIDSLDNLRIIEFMPKRTHSRDINKRAFEIVREATTEPISDATRSQVMSELGRKGGVIGGKRRMETLTPERRSEIASKAAQIRWKRKS